MGAGARSVGGVVCGVGACACGVAGEAVVEDAGEAGLEWWVVEASVVRPAGRHTTLHTHPPPPPEAQTLPRNSRLRLPTAVGPRLGQLLLVLFGLATSPSYTSAFPSLIVFS